MEREKNIRTVAVASTAVEQKIKIAIQLLMIILIIILHTKTIHAQKIWIERKGCVNSQANLAPGYFFQQKKVSAYIDGDMEIFFDNKFSFTGAAWYSFATSRKNEAGIKANHAVFWGANYHILSPGRFDLFIGLIPGAGLVQVAYKEGESLKKTPYSLVPLVSGAIGCNYYVGSIFHFFLKVQGVAGHVFSTLPTPQSLNELKLTAGLGYNIRLWKPKKGVLNAL